jgi:hypothetical protein
MATEPFTTFVQVLPSASSVSLADTLYLQQSGASKRTTVQAVAQASGALITPANYYIAANGNDSNSGTSPLSPWQTITKVNSVTPTPGSTFLFRGGDTFSGTLVVAASGQSALPIVYDSYEDGNATISSGNNSGLISVNFDNLIVRNLTFIGNVGVNTNNGIQISNPGNDCNNYLFFNLTISGYNWGIQLLPGHPGASPPNMFFTYMRNMTVKNCTIHDCTAGIQSLGQNDRENQSLYSPPYFLSQYNFLVDGCTVYNLALGDGITAQGIDGFTVQNCLVHDVGGSATGASLAGLYSANAANILWQFNELYKIYDVAGFGHDGIAMYNDFGVNNALVQYNYVHDCDNSAYSTTTGDLPSGHQNTDSVVLRYNIFVGCGSVNLTTGTGILLGTLGAGDTITNLYIYNNTIIGGFTTTVQAGGAQFVIGPILQNGTTQAIIANNIFVSDAINPILGNLNLALIKFVGNIYYGGGPTPMFTQTIANWLSSNVSGNNDQEAVDGLQVNSTATLGADPLLLGGFTSFGTDNLASLPTFPVPQTTGANNRGKPIFAPMSSSTRMQLAPTSAVSRLGIDLQTVIPMQVFMPYNNHLGVGGFPQFDFDFKGGRYYGGSGISDISCSRTATTATDLFESSPINAPYTTFAANTLRITPGRGLLVEGARTQWFTNPTAPASHTTVSIPNGTSMTMWCNGPGTVTLTNGSGTVSLMPGGGAPIATHGRPVPCNMTSTGTLTVTVSGTLYAFQLESPTNGTQTTSLITAQGTCDADVVTTSTGTTIGSWLQASLDGGGVNHPVSVFAYYNFPCGPYAVVNGILYADNSSNSSVFYATTFVDELEWEFTTGGTTIVTPKNLTQYGPHVTNSVAVRTDFNGGMWINFNAGPVVSGTMTPPSPTSPIHIGNRAAADLPFFGYIERLLGFAAGTSPTAAQMPVLTNVTPIAFAVSMPASTAITRDFFGNPAYFNNKIGIGAHQTTTVGGTVVLNGATPVTVVDPNTRLNSIIFFTLNTVGGTVGAVPSIKTITPGTGFTVAGTAGDTSVYNYVILG